MRALFLLGLFALSAFLCACGEDNEEVSDPQSSTKKPQGVIHYQVDYPEMLKKGMYHLLPKEMSMTYLGNTYKTVVAIKGLRFNTTLISDNDAHTLTAIYRFGKDQFYSEMSLNEVDEFLAEFPDINYEPSDMVDSAMTVQCKHTMAMFNDINKEIDVAYTTDLGIENTNWCNPYKGVDGVLLKYDLEYYGVLMSFKANEINRDTIIDPSSFSVPEGYKKVPYEKIKSELTKLFESVKPNKISTPSSSEDVSKSEEK